MPRGTRVTTIRTREELPPKQNANPYIDAVQAWFESGMESELLAGLHFKIRVQKYNADGKAETLVGTQYERLQGMLDTLRRRYAPARFKFFVQCFDQEGKFKGLCVEPDFPILPDTEEADDQGPEYDPQPLEGVRPAQPSVTDIMLKQMELQNQVLIALVTRDRGGAGGMGVGDLIKLIELGSSMGGRGSGEPLPPEKGDILDSILKGPLGEKIFERFFPAAGTGPAAVGAPAGPERPDPPGNHAPMIVRSD